MSWTMEVYASSVTSRIITDIPQKESIALSYGCERSSEEGVYKIIVRNGADYWIYCDGKYIFSSEQTKR